MCIQANERTSTHVVSTPQGRFFFHLHTSVKSTAVTQDAAHLAEFRNQAGIKTVPVYSIVKRWQQHEGKIMFDGSVARNTVGQITVILIHASL